MPQHTNCMLQHANEKWEYREECVAACKRHEEIAQEGREQYAAACEVQQVFMLGHTKGMPGHST